MAKRRRVQPSDSKCLVRCLVGQNHLQKLDLLFRKVEIFIVKKSSCVQLGEKRSTITVTYKSFPLSGAGDHRFKSCWPDHNKINDLADKLSILFGYILLSVRTWSDFAPKIIREKRLKNIQKSIKVSSKCLVNFLIKFFYSQ